MEEGYSSNQYYQGPTKFNMKEDQAPGPVPKQSKKKASQSKVKSDQPVKADQAVTINHYQNIVSPNGPSGYSVQSPHMLMGENNVVNTNGNVQPNYNQKHGNEKEEYTAFKDLPELERSIRIGFVRKVYGILTLQLLITFGLVCLTFITEVKNFLVEYYWVFYIAVGGAVIILLLLVCCKKISKKVPLNYILLFLWTIFESYMLMYASAYYDYQTVLSAIGITIGMSTGMTVYACFTKTNFSFLGNFLSGLLMLMLIMAMFGFVFSQWLRVVYCAVGVLVFSLYILFDTQQLLGKFRSKYDIDDYIVAALNIYMDIVNLFLMVLCLLGSFNCNS